MTGTPDAAVMENSQTGTLRRTLTLPYIVLYGLGVTVGAGIYVLIGEVIARSGEYAPVSFLVAGLVMLLPAAVFAELTGRLPFAAAEAHFVGTGFNSKTLFLIVGLAVAAVGIVSSAAIAHGAVGYIGQLIALPVPVLLVTIIIVTGIIAGIGIRQSIAIAGLLTLIEIGGLMAIVAGALWQGSDLAGQAVMAIPDTVSVDLWQGIAASSLLAFFAFIGFEDIDSMAEEAVDPQKTLSRAIFITLFLTMVNLHCRHPCCACGRACGSDFAKPRATGICIYPDDRVFIADDHPDCHRCDDERDYRPDHHGLAGDIRAGQARIASGPPGRRQ